MDSRPSDRWSKDRAWAWYRRQPWPCGFNYIPAHAISYTEMWMAYNFDLSRMDRELALAQDVGFNGLRVVLPFVVWEAEPQPFLERLDAFLALAQRRGLRVMFALFDDCAFGPITDPVFGPQPDVVPGWYANGWTPSPGHSLVRDAAAWPRLQCYVQAVIGAFRDDTRVWVWDLYNEPTNGVAIGTTSAPLGEVSIPLVEQVFAWARAINPAQPLTVAEWNGHARLNDLVRQRSDITTFHDYGDPQRLSDHIRELALQDRPTICTEWLNRGMGSTVAGCLPLFQQAGVGALHWGLVNGKTQTHLNWGHLPGQPDPPVAQHDLFRSDHTPYDPAEIAGFRAAVAAALRRRA